MAEENGADLAVSMFEIQVDTALKIGLDLNRRTMQIFGEIDSEMLAHVDTCIGLLEGGDGPATVRVCSEGGSVTDALAIVSRIRAASVPLDVEVHGIAHSAAIMILAGGPAKRRMSSLGWAMSHESSYVVEGPHTAVKHAVKQAEREEQAWNETMAKFTKMPVEFWSKSGRAGKDLYLSAKECLELGVCDELF